VHKFLHNFLEFLPFVETYGIGVQSIRNNRPIIRTGNSLHLIMFANEIPILAV